MCPGWPFGYTIDVHKKRKTEFDWLYHYSGRSTSNSKLGLATRPLIACAAYPGYARLIGSYVYNHGDHRYQFKSSIFVQAELSFRTAKGTVYVYGSYKIAMMYD